MMNLECTLCVSACKQSLQGRLCSLLNEGVYIDCFAESIHTEDALQNNAYLIENKKVSGSNITTAYILQQIILDYIAHTPTPQQFAGLAECEPSFRYWIQAAF